MYFLVRCKKAEKKKMGCDSQGITLLSIGPLFLVPERISIVDLKLSSLKLLSEGLSSDS